MKDDCFVAYKNFILTGDEFVKFNLSTISRIVIRRVVSIKVLLVSSSKLPYGNFPNQFWHWRSVSTSSLSISDHFFLEQQYVETANFHFPYLEGSNQKLLRRINRTFSKASLGMSADKTYNGYVAYV